MKYLLLLLLVACGQPVAQGSVDANEYVMGSIRFDHDSQEWNIQADSDHAPTGIDHLVTYDDHVEVFFKFTASKVVTMIISPDETYAKNGIEAGPSIGLNSAIVYYGKNGAALLSSEMDYPYSNLLIYGVFVK